MPPKRMKAATNSTKHNPPKQSTQEDVMVSDSVIGQELQAELVWCLDKLEKALEDKTIKEKAANDALRAWKVLSSPRSPLVKIRQTMRMMFGDYRAKMAQEEKEFGLRPQHMNIDTATSSKSKYFKSSAHCPENIMKSTTKNFQFGFSINGDRQPDSSSKDTIIETNSTPMLNYYHMGSSHSNTNSGDSVGFQFDFNIDKRDAL